jgi:hypothetical protein
LGVPKTREIKKVTTSRDDKKERVAERGGPLPRDRAQPLVMTEERVVPGREVAEPKPFFIFIGGPQARDHSD